MNREECYEEGFGDTADVLVLVDSKPEYAISSDCIHIKYDSTTSTVKNCLEQIVREYKKYQNEIELEKEKMFSFLFSCNDENNIPSLLPVELKSVIACTFFHKVKQDRKRIIDVTPDLGVEKANPRNVV